MSNPVLNEKVFNNWAPPQPGTEARGPISDGPSSPWRPASDVMTIGGTISATATLLALLLASATVGWLATGAPVSGEYGLPGLAILGVIVGIASAFAIAFRPQLARIVGPVYALAQGFAVGSISRVYEEFYDGIVIQAAGVTIAVFAVMLGLYRSGAIRVTDRFRRTIVMATIGVMVFYGISLLISLFGGSVAFISSPSLFGIGFSIFVAGLAAMNLALDFDFIERGTTEGLPRHFEWFAAFGMLVTIVWLYLEILRLLAKLRER